MRKSAAGGSPSLIVVIILVPLLLLGINQVRGEGLCYTNLREFYLAHAFLGKMKAGDYEGATKYVDRETRRGEFQERFTEEELANYDQDAIDTFVAAAQGYTEMGRTLRLPLPLGWICLCHGRRRIVRWGYFLPL